MKLETIKCPECRAVLAEPKFKSMPPIYRNSDFENFGDKAKIFNFTDKATFLELPDERKLLCKLGCTCGWRLVNGG